MKVTEKYASFHSWLIEKNNSNFSFKNVTPDSTAVFIIDENGDVLGTLSGNKVYLTSSYCLHNLENLAKRYEKYTDNSIEIEFLYDKIII